MINVTYDSHPDLYYALRGAGLGANFGIVTSFIAKAMPASAQLSGTTTYTEEHLSHVLQEVYNLTAGSKADDLDAWWNFRYDYNVTTDSFGIAMPHGYTRPVRHPEVFANLETIPSTSNSLQIAAEREFVAEEAERTPNGLRLVSRSLTTVFVVLKFGRNLFGTITYRPSPELDQEIFNIFRSLVPSIANASGVYPNIINQALYASYLPFMRERGGNCVGLKDLEGSYTGKCTPLNDPTTALLKILSSIPLHSVLERRFRRCPIERVHAKAHRRRLCCVWCEECNHSVDLRQLCVCDAKAFPTIWGGELPKAAGDSEGG